MVVGSGMGDAAVIVALRDGPRSPRGLVTHPSETLFNQMKLGLVPTVGVPPRNSPTASLEICPIPILSTAHVKVSGARTPGRDNMTELPKTCGSVVDVGDVIGVRALWKN